MAIEKFDSDEGGAEHFREAMGPGMIDNQLRQAVQCCWMVMPKPRRNLDEVEKEVRLILDRVFRNMRDDERRNSG